MPTRELRATDGGGESSPTTDEHFDFTVRVDTSGIRDLYTRARAALLDAGYQPTEVVDVMRVIEHLVGTSVERDSRRLQVRLHALPSRTHVKAIDRRRLDPREVLPSEVVPRQIARASGSRPMRDGAGLTLWAIVDRPTSSDGSPERRN